MRTFTLSLMITALTGAAAWTIGHALSAEFARIAAAFLTAVR